MCLTGDNDAKFMYKEFTGRMCESKLQNMGDLDEALCCFVLYVKQRFIEVSKHGVCVATTMALLAY